LRSSASGSSADEDTAGTVTAVGAAVAAKDGVGEQEGRGEDARGNARHYAMQSQGECSSRLLRR
ncbi:hypothetical protein, partial [Streptomyces bobili]|uniref:hypothetical protein n=1 Tax=Streptomyces bobili TaxID=67280 RepID=UPI00370F9A0B